MYTLSAVIDRFEKGKAVMRFDDGQEIILAKRQLPSNIEEGSVIVFDLYRDSDAEKRRENVARFLLEEILESNEKNKST